MNITEQAKKLIEAQGFRITRGPFLNPNKVVHGIFMVSVKSPLRSEQLKSLGIKLSKDEVPGRPRTVRFLLDVEGDVVKAAKHISASDRKKASWRRLPAHIKKEIRLERARDKRKGRGKCTPVSS